MLTDHKTITKSVRISQIEDIYVKQAIQNLLHSDVKTFSEFVRYSIYYFSNHEGHYKKMEDEDNES